MYFIKQGLPVLSINLKMPWALTVMCVTKWYIGYSEYMYSSYWLYMYKVCQKIYKAEINWSSLLIYGDLN